MGLESVEIQLNLEDRFGIEFLEDENAFLFSTPQRIAGLVWDKLHGINPAVPDLQQLLARIGRSLDQLPDRPQGVFRRMFAGTKIERLVPETRRCENWRAFGAALGVELPKLIEQETGAVPRIPTEVPDPLSLAWWIVDHFPEQVDWLRPERANSVAREEVEWSRDQIWESVREIISDALTVKLDQVTPTARMIEDLGMA